MYVVCKRIISRTRTLVRCHRNGCMRESFVENIDKIEEIDPKKRKMLKCVFCCLNLRVLTEQMKKNILLRFLMWKEKKNVVMSVVLPSIDKNKPVSRFRDVSIVGHFWHYWVLSGTIGYSQALLGTILFYRVPFGTIGHNSALWSIIRHFLQFLDSTFRFFCMN